VRPSRPVTHLEAAPEVERLAVRPDADGPREEWPQVSVDGGMPVRLTDDPAQDRFPHFTPDGRSLLYTSRRSGDWEIWRRDLATRVHARR
jgi:hypothetical protein